MDNSIQLNDNLESVPPLSQTPAGYFLSNRVRVGPDRIKSQFIRQIPNEQMDEFTDACGVLSGFYNCYSLFQICDKNYHDILNYHDQLETCFHANRADPYEFIEDVVFEINRLLLNYLSSFRTLVDHLEARYKHLKRENPEYLNAFKTICSSCYGGSFYYRFFYKLRNYVQHCCLPIGHIEIEETQKGTNISIIFDRDALLNNYSEWGSTVKNDLSSRPESIDIFVALSSFAAQISLIKSEVMLIEINLAVNSYTMVNDLINEVLVQYPSGEPIIGCLNKTEPILETYNFPFHQLKVFRDQYEITQQKRDHKLLA